MSNGDLPKIWIDEEENVDPITGEVINNTQALMPIEEEIPLPTVEEQKAIISTTTVSEENKGMLNALIEMNNVANVLESIRNTESQERRRSVVQAWSENFINARMKNNVVAETLKNKLLLRLIDNLDNLDLSTSAQIYTDLTDVSNVDAQQAMAAIMGASNTGINSPSGGINLTINNASADGAMITNNTLNTNQQTASQLKEVTTLNSSIKAWNNVPLPKKKPIDVEYIENKK